MTWLEEPKFTGWRSGPHGDASAQYFAQRSDGQWFYVNMYAKGATDAAQQQGLALLNAFLDCRFDCLTKIRKTLETA